MIFYLSFDLVVEQKICVGWIYHKFLAWVLVILQARCRLVLEKVSRVEIQLGRTFLRVRGCLQLCQRSECIAGSIVIQGKTFDQFIYFWNLEFGIWNLRSGIIYLYLVSKTNRLKVRWTSISTFFKCLVLSVPRKSTSLFLIRRPNYSTSQIPDPRFQT